MHLRGDEMTFEEFKAKMHRDEPQLSDEQIADIYDHDAMTNGRVAPGPPFHLDIDYEIKDWDQIKE